MERVNGVPADGGKEAGWGRKEPAKPGRPGQLWSVRRTSGRPTEARGLGCQSAERVPGGWAAASDICQPTLIL